MADQRGRAAADSRTRSRRRHEVIECRGAATWERSSASISRFRSSTSAKPEQALAQARRAQAEARVAAFQAALHAEVAALRTIVLERRQAADSYRASTATSAAQLERIAQVSYDAGERSILELVDAYRNSGSTRLRQVALDAAARHAEIELELVSGWEIQ